MKILYLLDKFSPKTDETFIVNEMVALKQLGHIVVIAANAREAGEEFHEEIKNHRLLDDTVYPSGRPNFAGYKNGAQKALDFFPKFFRDFIESPLQTAKTARIIGNMSRDIWIFLDDYLLARQVRDMRIDIIHAPFSYLRHLEQAVSLSNLLRVPFTYAFRSGDLYVELRTAREKEFMKKGAKIITISNYSKSSCMEKFGIREVEVIHSSINIQRFRSLGTKRVKKIICVCRFIECKGVEYLIEACGILKEKGEDFTCALIGGGPLRDRYEKLIKDRHLEGVITIKGFLTQEEVKKELDDSMVFVLPCVILENGEKDILPNAVKEAMAMEIPVVTSDICGIEELVRHDENGLLVPSRDSTAIARAIERLFKDEQLRERLGKKGRETIERDFNVEKESKKFEKIFEEAIDSYNSSLTQC